MSNALNFFLIKKKYIILFILLYLEININIILNIILNIETKYSILL